MGAIAYLILITLACAGISHTITTTSMFKWFRELLSPIHHKVEELVHCPWCFGHYVMMFGLLVFWNHIFFLDIPNLLHLILNWFACITVMGLIHYVTLRAYEPIAKAMMHRELMKLQDEDDEPE
jgi:hypothetical protein